MQWPTRFHAITTLMIILLAVLALWLWTPDKDRAELERLYLAAPTDMVDVAGTRLHVRLHVRNSGPKDAPAVVLLHGFGASLHTWEPWAAALAATHRVIRFDPARQRPEPARPDRRLHRCAQPAIAAGAVGSDGRGTRERDRPLHRRPHRVGLRG